MKNTGIEAGGLPGGNYAPEKFSVTDKYFIPLTETIEQHALLSPDHIALRFKEESVTYGQLNEKVNQLAAYLADSGVTKETLVCICLEQSVEKVVCMLAVLKAGGAYVPVDPNYPAGRIRFILEDTAAGMLITTKALAAKASVPVNQIICIDNDTVLQSLRKQPTGNLLYKIEPSDLAYIIYTSGSTGTPKGVLIEHFSFSTFTTNHAAVMGITKDSKTLQFSSTSFDAAVIDLWIPLQEGATVYLYPDNRLIGAPLLDFIINNEIDTLPLLPPSVLASLPVNIPTPKLKVIGIGGEVCPAHTLQHWSARCTLINSYGPTEATVAVTSFVCRPDISPKVIGKEKPGVLLYVLDEHMREVPVGATGELYITGVQVARGYLNRPELTAERFPEIPETLKSADNSDHIRFYKTGDMVKRLPDGNLEFADRKDNQVKIRGYRIEPGEIENVLNNLPGIRQAVILPMKNDDGSAFLAAFIINDQTDAATAGQDYRNQLLQLLPAYMVPDYYELVASFPLNAHGKVDKEKLGLTPVKGATREKITLADIVPGNYEAIISTIWSSFLHCDIKNYSDDFFLLGGHSLLLMQVYEAFPDAIKKYIHIPDLYTYTTIQTLAAEIRLRENSAALSQKEKEQMIIRELLDDAKLRMEINITDIPDAAILENPNYIFLTGATGFVGAHLLYELLHDTTSKIYCLVRAADNTQAINRLQQTFQKFRLGWSDDLAKKILPVTGDLSQPFFGMDAAAYKHIAANTDVIYHSGSSVSYLQPYPVIKGPNIDGLQEVIRLATTTKVKYLALLSSMGVFSWGRPFTGNTWMNEQDDIDQNLPAVSCDLGYIKSKWVMEKMMQEAIARGLPVINFRLGFAVCSGITGATVLNQWWGSLVRSCVQTGAFPLVMGLKDELTTVDYMAKAIVHIGRKKEAVGKNFHLSPDPENDVSLTDFFAKMNEYYDLELKGLPYHEWLNLWRHDTENPLYPLLSLFTDDVHEGKSLVEAYENTYYYDRSNTRDFLADSSLTPPRFDKKLMTPYLEYMDVLK
ncbi:non-ribosomal peptide synthetase family protein [Chitinophagaceae bacterium MMS25-I14]